MSTSCPWGIASEIAFVALIISTPSPQSRVARKAVCV